ncbi:Uncharacterized protein F751_2412 [Auxenochlorella protothecoides]|uniref:Photolyase/cryptochrome alpha/beta domain-containing protein n=1 Tax=Auxenochlorella protothecoides TaxID=3075 RepID=A0A087SG40_AUXPR|nr:Uncharacterized protein F751_2412 [Auxenochlorella protothecoides]KFM24694.1 Uncharacterized protein F751_2412 [Auxenochlorella protothecoides]
MLAVFCYDPEVYAHTVLDGAAHGAQALATALQRLTRDLADRGVQLLVTSGSWQEVIPDLAAAADVRRVLAEDEVESGARARDGVAAYLRLGLQGDAEESGAELASLVEQHSRPAHPSGCFPAIFSRALTLGALSRRRVAAQARAVLADPAAAGRQGLWRLRRQNRTAKAHVALAAVEASDFHLEMARAREDREVHGARLGHWRWRGTLTDYLVAGDPSAPAILLVHGFGAFGEHWRGNVAALARAGYAVYAPTLPGYGRSEKQALPYGQDLWTSFLCEFVVHVVRQPVTVVGNSIGGFVAASLAGDHPSLVHGLVLVNSAGKVEPGYVAPEKTYSDVAQSGSPLLSPTLINLVSSGLFGLLKGNVKRQLKQLYPSAPERADAWLAAEIVRAATDPGSKGVFTSVFYLQKPRPLNHLVAEMYGGPVLVLQVVMLEAGHCPHDEVPEEFNARLLEWMEGLEPAGTARAGALPAII